MALIHYNALNDNWIRQVSSNEETIDNLDKQLADSKITLSDSENKFDDISRKLVRSLFIFWHYKEAVHLLTLTVSVDLAMILRDIILLDLGKSSKKRMFFIYSIKIWFVDTQTHILSHCEGSQKYIFHALFVVANDHPEGPASCKW